MGALEWGHTDDWGVRTLCPADPTQRPLQCSPPWGAPYLPEQPTVLGGQSPTSVLPGLDPHCEPQVEITSFLQAE